MCYRLVHVDCSMRICLWINVYVCRCSQRLILYRNCFLLHKSCQVVESTSTVVYICGFACDIFQWKWAVLSVQFLMVPKTVFTFELHVFHWWHLQIRGGVGKSVVLIWVFYRTASKVCTILLHNVLMFVAGLTLPAVGYQVTLSTSCHGQFIYFLIALIVELLCAVGVWPADVYCQCC